MIRARRMAALAAVGLGLAAGAGSAQAATVSVGPSDPTGEGDMGDLSFVAAPGEANRVSVGLDATGAAVVADAGASLAPGAGCTPVDLHTARCSGSPATGALELVDLVLGDGDDTATLAVPRLAQVGVDAGAGNDTVDGSASPGLTGLQDGKGFRVVGQAGDDRITGSPEFDDLDGGPGNDAIDGGASPDTIDGGPGDDILLGGAGGDELSGDGSNDLVPVSRGGNDVIDGGPGLNQLDYDEHTSALHIDLARGTATSDAGEHDQLSHFNDVIGGQAGDVIRGTSGDDNLRGSLDQQATEPGDVLVGRAGDDRLSTGGKGSRLVGGRGADDLEVTDDAPLRLICGPGRDTVDSVFARSFVRASCEVVHTSAYDFSHLRVSRRRVRLHASPNGGDRVTLTLRSRHGRLYGRVRLRRHRHRPVIRLTRAGRRAVRGHHLVVARLGHDGESWVWRL